jgi:hypothetical protein
MSLSADSADSAATNPQLAEQLRAQADDAMHRRKVLLVAAVALAESNSIAGARKILDDWDGPPAIKAEAIEVLGDLTADVPAQDGAAQEGTT